MGRREKGEGSKEKGNYNPVGMVHFVARDFNPGKNIAATFMWGTWNRQTTMRNDE